MAPQEPPPPSVIDPRPALGRRVAQLRAEHALTQAALAHRAGLARSYVASLERGRRNVGLVNLARLAAAFDVPLAALFDGEPAPGDPLLPPARPPAT